MSAEKNGTGAMVKDLKADRIGWEFIIKRCNSRMALTLGAVITMLAIQNYVVTTNLPDSFDTALGAADVFLCLLGLLSLSVVRNRSKRRQDCTSNALSIGWFFGQQSRCKNPVLKEVEQR